MSARSRLLQTHIVAAALLLTMTVLAGGTADAEPRVPGGTVDQTFGEGGVVFERFPSLVSEYVDVAVQPDGRIVAVGTLYAQDDGDFILVRYLPDGSRDPSFGDNGFVRTSFTEFYGMLAEFDVANEVLLQPDGRIVVVGEMSDFGRPISDVDYNFAIARYLPDGRLDPSFGEGGKVVTDFGAYEGAEAAALLPDGRLVVVGTRRVPGASDSTAGNFAVAVYTDEGKLDTRFGGDGRVTTSFGAAEEAGAVLVLPREKRILAAGSSNGDFALAAYRLDGTLDHSFGDRGRLTLDLGGNEGVESIAMQRARRFVVGGTTTKGGASEFALVRFRADGKLDRSFNKDGIVTTKLGDRVSLGDVVALRCGDLIVAGTTVQPDAGGSARADLALVRYRWNGKLNRHFGSGGKATASFGESEYGYGGAVLPDGRIVVVGKHWFWDVEEQPLVAVFSAGQSSKLNWCGKSLGK